MVGVSRQKRIVGKAAKMVGQVSVASAVGKQILRVTDEKTKKEVNGVEQRGVLCVCDGRGIGWKTGTECVMETVKRKSTEGSCDMGWVAMLGMRAVIYHKEGW